MAPRDWNQFRGPNRDGKVEWLPESLPANLSLKWKSPLPSKGIGGIAANGNVVIVGSRDPADMADIYQAFDTATGVMLWQQMTLAPGRLDYGNSPRATPLIHGTLVITQGAFGHLACRDLLTGIPLWEHHFPTTFTAPMPQWGFAASPLIVEDVLVVQPGGARAGLVGLDVATGEVLWKSPGKPAAYASPILHADQIIGLDKLGVVGWDASTGQESWRIIPKVPGDFGVPSPIVTSEGLLLTSENNGTRLYRYESQKQPGKLIAQMNRVAPNSHSPVVIGDRVFVADKSIYCLDLSDNLKTLWKIRDRAIGEYAALIADDDRLLALTSTSQLLLIDAETGDIESRLELTSEATRTLSHPALVGTVLYARIADELMAIDLNER